MSKDFISFISAIQLWGSDIPELQLTNENLNEEQLTFFDIVTAMRK